jgi:small subunit ribosomal protein S7e
MSARNKIIKPTGVQPDELELAVGQAIFDLENNVPELKADLRAVQIVAAKEVRSPQ